MTRFDTPYNQRVTPPHRVVTDAAPSAVAAGGARKWNSWWSRRSPNLLTNDNEPVALGIDAGSKTIKLVALDADGQIVYALYHRHRSDVRTTLADLLHDVIWRYGDASLPVAITGSAGIALAEALGIPFVQEVVATTNAVKRRYPDADCIIELGGEDAKITYLTGNIEQRMNATCAGGTGDFIDGIASMLGIKTRDISKLALGSQRTYPIASRCAVFAQTDVRPLINAGARKADIAQSALEAVVRQTLGGLACGRPITGKVVFLGGPLEHIPALVIAFRRKLGLTQKTGIKPLDAHLYTAMGAVFTVENPPVIALSELERRARAAEIVEDETGWLPPLFDNAAEIEEFYARHQEETIPRCRLEDVQGPLYLGFDAGSTTIKYALVDSDGALVAQDYRNVEGDTLKTARDMLGELLLGLEGNAYANSRRTISRAVVTGYGEGLLETAFGFDEGAVETVAHLRAAYQFRPDASFVLDIGGQDMKALWVQDGHVVDAVLNEACSSGCGAFVQSSARSLQLQHVDFSRLALEARHPIDLGAKCTVFMTSRVRHAQKAGAPKGDIAAGIAYSVVNNVMTRIIGKNHVAPLGDSIVVQGGTFKSDAVLRAFEKVAGVHATRPDCAHLMGAYGAALLALDSGESQSSLVNLEQLSEINPKKAAMRCPGCSNSCLLSIVDFGNGKRFISGNRCERAIEAVFGEPMPHAFKAPNVVELEQKLLAGFGDVESAAPRGDIAVGLMNTLNMYEAMPFWHTLFAELGFSIVMPDDEGVARLADRAAETIPSESVCHPAKISHARYAYLVEAGADFVFMPTFDRGTRCPVAACYASALAGNVDGDCVVSPKLRPIKPRAITKRETDRMELFNAICSMDPDGNVGRTEFDDAVETALKAQEAFESTITAATQKAFVWARADEGRRVAVLAGRPYHVDPTLNHRIDAELARLGFAVVPLLGMSDSLAAFGAKGLWKPSKHMLRLVEFAARDPQVDIVALRSFGCIYDAVSFDEARDLATRLACSFTELKIDDIENIAHIRIRLRTLAYTSTTAPCHPERSASAPPCHPERSAQSARSRRIPPSTTPNNPSGIVPTPDLCSTAKALVERCVASVANDPQAASVTVPLVCVDCLTDALPFELKHILGHVCAVDVQPGTYDARTTKGDRPKVGFVGNPLLVFDDELNEGVAKLVDRLGWQVVYPDPVLIEVDDVRYIDQLERFRNQGVERIIYLQSFGCLKGHVQSRGALRNLARRFPDMPITIIDYDPESSALNRENRIRLALTHD